MSFQGRLNSDSDKQTNSSHKLAIPSGDNSNSGNLHQHQLQPLHQQQQPPVRRLIDSKPSQRPPRPDSGTHVRHQNFLVDATAPGGDSSLNQSSSHTSSRHKPGQSIVKITSPGSNSGLLAIEMNEGIVSHEVICEMDEDNLHQQEEQSLHQMVGLHDSNNSLNNMMDQIRGVDPPQIEGRDYPVNLQVQPLKKQLEFKREVKQENTRAIVPLPNGKLKIANSSLHVTPFTDYEIERAKSALAIREEESLKQIQILKQQVQKTPYFEPVEKCNFQLQLVNKHKQMKRSSTAKLNGRLVNKKRPNSALQPASGQNQEAQPTAFQGMTIDELKQHEQGIMNLFENQIEIKRYAAQHNISPDKRGKYVRLNRGEYDKIFQSSPTFNEKRAFVGIFRQKWRQEKKHTSLFDRRSIYKSSKEEKNTEQARLTALQLHYQTQAKEKLRSKTPTQTKYVSTVVPKLAENQDIKDQVRDSQASILTQMHLKQLSQEAANQTHQKRVFTSLSKYDGSSMIKRIARTSSGCIAVTEVHQKIIKDAYRAKSAKNITNFVPSKDDYLETPEQSAMELAGQQAKFHQQLHAHNQDQLNYFVTEMYNTADRTAWNPVNQQSSEQLAQNTVAHISQDSASILDQQQDHISIKDNLKGQQTELKLMSDQTEENTAHKQPLEKVQIEVQGIRKTNNQKEVIIQNKKQPIVENDQNHEIQRVVVSQKQLTKKPVNKDHQMLSENNLHNLKQYPTALSKDTINLNEHQSSDAIVINGEIQGNKNASPLLGSLEKQRPSMTQSSNQQQLYQMRYPPHNGDHSQDTQQKPLNFSSESKLNVKQHGDISDENKGNNNIQNSYSKLSNLSLVKLQGKNYFASDLENVDIEQPQYDHSPDTTTKAGATINLTDVKKEQLHKIQSKEGQHLPATATVQAQPSMGLSKNNSLYRMESTGGRSKRRPSVFNLPLNPMSNKQYKCNFIKARVEFNRLGQHDNKISYVPANQPTDKGPQPYQSQKFQNTQNSYVKNQKRVMVRQRLNFGADLVRRTKDVALLIDNIGREQTKKRQQILSVQKRQQQQAKTLQGNENQSTTILARDKTSRSTVLDVQSFTGGAVAINSKRREDRVETNQLSPSNRNVNRIKSAVPLFNTNSESQKRMQNLAQKNNQNSGAQNVQVGLPLPIVMSSDSSRHQNQDLMTGINTKFDLENVY